MPPLLLFVCLCLIAVVFVVCPWEVLYCLTLVSCCSVGLTLAFAFVCLLLFTVTQAGSRY